MTPFPAPAHDLEAPNKPAAMHWLRASPVSVHVVGDAKAPRLIRTAISEGARTGARL